MNSFIRQSLVLPLVVTLALVASLSPLALLLHGTVGLNVVFLAGIVTASIVLLTAMAQVFLRDPLHHPLKHLAVVGGLRMVLSLVAVSASWLVVRQFSQPESLLLYAVPFYAGLLVAESAVIVRQFRHASAAC